MTKSQRLTIYTVTREHLVEAAQGAPAGSNGARIRRLVRATIGMVETSSVVGRHETQIGQLQELVTYINRTFAEV